MPDQHGFGNNGTESARPCQSGHGDDQMNEQDEEVAHPGNGVRDLNRMVWEVSPDNFYATMFYAHIDGPRHELHYVNAGHDRVILLRDDLTRAVNLESTGTVLGLSTKAAYDQRTIPLEPGDVLVAVTDGITDAADSDGHMLDEDAILQVVRDHPEGSSSDLAGYIIREVDAFTGGALPADDRTVVVVRFLGAMMDALVEIPIKERAFAHLA